MVIHCHVHVSAFSLPHGSMSTRLEKSLAFRFMRRRLGITGNDAEADRQIAERMNEVVVATPQLDAAAVLAFDAVYDPDGKHNPAKTHLYVSNDYLIELAARYPKVLFGASVHPYRKDAVQEIERCVRAGAVLLKWLPIVQDFDPSDARCMPVYEALAHYQSAHPLVRVENHIERRTGARPPCSWQRLADPGVPASEATWIGQLIADAAGA